MSWFRYSRTKFAAGAAAILFLSGCAAGGGDPIRGPDKQAEGTLYGAMLGAGSGAVTAAQFGTLGPGAWIGAGMGGLFGMASGMGIDILEEDEIRRQEDLEFLRKRAWVQQVLQDHYDRRLTLHPNRDIFPADLFFDGDSAKVRKDGDILLQYLALMTKKRAPWSRILVTSYMTSAEDDSHFATSINERRVEEVANVFVHCGVEARRIVTQGVILSDPLVRDPDDHPGRYRQVIEFLPLDL